MNGLTERTSTQISSQHRVAPLTDTGAQQTFQPVATHGCTRDAVRGGARATGVPHPLMGEARSNRVA